MIKEGDIIICIKSYYIIDDLTKFIYNKDDTWKIKGIFPGVKYNINAVSINTNEVNNFSHDEIKKNWISLAEWRDQQINSILYGI